jgi:1,4-alpha-glucan branching enzyme
MSNADTVFQAYVSLKHEVDKTVVYERAGLLFIFNFHPTKSFTDYRVGVDEPGEYRIALSSDEDNFGGFNNIALDSKYFTTPMEWNGRRNWLQVSPAQVLPVQGFPNLPKQVYIPSRTCLILTKD